MTAEAAVRQPSIALITFNWPRLTWPRLAVAPSGAVVAEDIRDLQGWTNTIEPDYLSASSLRPSLDLGPNGVSRSSGLITSRIKLVATWV